MISRDRSFCRLATCSLIVTHIDSSCGNDGRAANGDALSLPARCLRTSCTQNALFVDAEPLQVEHERFAELLDVLLRRALRHLLQRIVQERACNISSNLQQNRQPLIEDGVPCHADCPAHRLLQQQISAPRMHDDALTSASRWFTSIGPAVGDTNAPSRRQVARYVLHRLMSSNVQHAEFTRNASRQHRAAWRCT